jgi:hypothetical protein
VTYNGNENTPDNVRFYWTLLDATRTNANQIGSTSMTNDLPVAPTIFAIGNVPGRSASAKANFLGLIDEVRISSVARGANEMMFGAARPVITSVSYNGTSLILSGANGIAGNTYYVLASTNVVAALSNWQRVSTNVFGANGVFSATNTVSSAIPRCFYLLQLP